MPDTTNTSNIPTAVPPPPPPMGDLSVTPPPPPGGKTPTTPPPSGAKPLPIVPKMKVVEKADIKDGGGLIKPKLTNEKTNKDEKKDMEKKAKDLISSTGKPGGKKKKMIATILGVLFLVGAVGATAILVQRNADIRERAALLEPCKICVGTSCDTVASPPLCTSSENECTDNASCGEVATECNTGEKYCRGVRIVRCKADGTWANPVECGGGKACIDGACSSPVGGDGDDNVVDVGRVICAEGNRGYTNIDARIVVNQSDFDECSGGTLYVNHYKCPGVSTMPAGGCNTGGRRITNNPEMCEPFSFDKICGCEQIDIGCTTGGDSSAYISACNWPSSCDTTTTTTTTTDDPPLIPGLTTQCLNVKVYDTSWNEISDLTTLASGDVIRFAVAGSATSGTIDKARFTINGTLRPEVTGKKPGTNEFFDEYTIPVDTTTFSIKGELYHSSGVWF